MKTNGARLFLEMLKLHGVKDVFGLPGETTLALYREWERFPDVRHILTHDERAAAFMAEAYAKAAGRVGVSEAPSPGGAHPAPGVLESFKGSVPTVCFTSDVPFNNDTRNTLSGFDQNRLYEAITKDSILVTRAADIPHLVRRAFRTALAARPGAVHERIPYDVYEEEVDIPESELYGGTSLWPADRPVADFDRIDEAIRLLAEAKRPVIVCGQGALVSGAGPEVRAVAEALSIPVGTTMTGKGAVSEAHPLSIRVVGARGGTSYSNQFIKDADLVFFVGSNTDSAGTDGRKLPSAAAQPRIIQLDISRQEAGNNYRADAALVGDAKATLSVMAERIRERGVSGSAVNGKEAAEAMAALDSSIEAAAASDEFPVHPIRFVKALEARIPEKNMVMVEPSTGSIFSAAYLIQKNEGRMFLSGYSMGALGYSLPAAVGAAVARPDHTIVSLGGDGSFYFNCGELETYSRLGLDIKYVLFNNNVFGWIRGEIEHVYNANPFATDFRQVDYCKIAEGFGIRTFRIGRAEQVEQVLEEAFSYRGPAFIEMPVKSQDALVPPIPRWIPNAKKKSLPYHY
ncbi:MAG: thiamine pyrophosphate-binding protein [Synergistaceae bacterium]|nr:thiamine pyrophosphate-binding protein [Synergistaceae bacterium]